MPKLTTEQKRLHEEAAHLYFDDCLSLRKIALKLKVKVSAEAIRLWISDNPRYKESRSRLYPSSRKLLGYSIQVNGDTDYCPRCVGGVLIIDARDIACLACGWRQS